MQRKVRGKASWEHFMICDGKPKINSQRELSSYCYHLHENVHLENFNSWQDFIEKINFALDVLRDIQAERINCVGQPETLVPIDWYDGFINELKKEVLAKFDELIVHIVARADNIYEERKQERKKTKQ